MVTWNSVWPVGTVSVRANRTTGAQNTEYIEVNMGNTVAGAFPQSAETRDHFWKVSSDFDGRHRFIQSPKFESPVGTAANPLLGTQMDGVQFIKLVNTDVNKVECFYKNSDVAVGNYPGIYQTSPSFQSGTVAVTSSNTNLGDAIPKNCYGEIFMFKLDDNSNFSIIQQGIFKSAAANMVVLALGMVDSAGSSQRNLYFSNTAFQLRVKTGSDGSTGNWQYRITYRAI